MKQRRPLLLFLSAVLTVAASGVSPSPSSAKESTTKGVVLFATVSRNGTVVNGSATAATKLATGSYLVTFNTNISQCAAVANAGSVGSDTGAAFAFSSTHPAILATTNVQVMFLVNEPELGPVDTPFHLIVAC